MPRKRPARLTPDLRHGLNWEKPGGMGVQKASGPSLSKVVSILLEFISFFRTLGLLSVIAGSRLSII